ncbi:MAG: HpcH/HpaI aldolase/citrate lyase family protein [Janthinobacterium lividum]
MNQLYRSALFVPGSRPERFAKALASGADAVIVDFEDAVEEGLKAQARAQLGIFFDLHPAVRVWVRVNAAAHAEHTADLAFCSDHPQVSHVVLPKAESHGQIIRAAATGKPVVPIIESATGVLQLGEIARSPGVATLAFGGIDYALDLNLNDGTPGATFALDQARLAVVLHARSAGLAAPLDGVFPAIADEAGLRAAIGHARDMGFAGTLCIHPRQVAPIHAVLSIDAAQVAWAERVVAQAAQNAGAFQLDGQMIDAPVLARARRLLAQPSADLTAG